MKTFLSVAGFVILFLVLVLGIDWIATGNDFFIYQYFAPKRVAVEYKTFKESQSYNEGMVRELNDKRLAYINASPEAKPAIASIILHEAETYPEDKMPSDLRQFIEQLKANQFKVEN